MRGGDGRGRRKITMQVTANCFSAGFFPLSHFHDSSSDDYSFCLILRDNTFVYILNGMILVR